MNKTRSSFDDAHGIGFKGSKKVNIWRDGYLPKTCGAYLREIQKDVVCTE